MISMSGIGIYNARVGGHNHVIIVEEGPHTYSAGYIGLPDAFTPITKSSTAGIVTSNAVACNTREAALLLAIRLYPFQG